MTSVEHFAQMVDDAVDGLETEHGNRRSPWPVVAAGACLWAVALGVTVVTVVADRLANRFLNGGNRP